jgi:RNA polymerase sigma-70 factor (ECF subfamily)
LSDLQPDSELVALAAGGDRDAFATLCRRHQTRLWRITCGVARGADAEDLAQEAIVRAWCAIDSCRSAGSFEAWLCRIAVNAARDYHKSAWRRRVVFTGSSDVEAETSDDSMAQAAERNEVARRLRRAVAALPQRQCTPIWLHYFEQFSIAEIAELEQIPESTVRSRIKVGMRRLRNALDDLIMEHESVTEPIGVAKGIQI